MDQQPKIPTLKDAQKPQVKIKGLGAGLTIFDRLKQFKKKDLAFILAGLGTLFMAPLAEHFMMAPETGSELKSGFGSGPGGTGSNLFGSGSSPYETTGGGIAQGGAIGGAGDIITPLNVRDPSALVMGPGAAQQPPAGSAAPAAPPPTVPASTSEDLKDALAHSASRAASAAVKKAPLPVPKVALGGSGLRGLGVAGGGTSASGGLGPINSGNLGQAGTGGGGLNLVRGAPAYKGVAGARGPGNPTGLDGTKKAGQNAGDAFSRTGSALSGLNAAASEQIPTGASGFGGGGQGGAGANDKSPGGSGPGGSKSVGESLAFLEAKQRMEENLKLEFEKRKLKDPELLMYGIRNDALKLIAGKMSESLAKSITGMMDGSAAAGAKGFTCSNGMKLTAPPKPECPEKGPYLNCARMGLAGGAFAWYAASESSPAYTCSPSDGKDPAADPKTEGGGVDGTGGMSRDQAAAMRNLGTVCTKATTEASNPDAGVKAWAGYLGASANHSASAQKALTGMAPTAPCTATAVGGERSLKDLQAEILGLISGAGASDAPEPPETLTGKIKAGAVSEKAVNVPTADVVAKVEQARKVLGEIKSYIEKAPAVQPLPTLYTGKVEKDKAAALEQQLVGAKNTVTEVMGRLETVQQGIDKEMASIKEMVDAGEGGVLKNVIKNNEDLAKVAAKTKPEAGYEGLAVAPAATVDGNVVVSKKDKTEAAVTAAQEPIKTADAKVEEYKTAKAAAEPAEPKETKAKREADAETAKTAANAAVKTAVEEDVKMRKEMIGWADQTKRNIVSLAGVVGSGAAAPAGTTPPATGATPPAPAAAHGAH